MQTKDLLESQPIKSPKRLQSPDAIRVLALLMVLLIHTIPGLDTLQDHTGSFEVWMANGLHLITRTSVPLFFMISGWLTLRDKDQGLFEFFTKRFLRVVLPFLFYAGIFYAWMILYQKKSFTIRIIISEILNFRLMTHFWFVYAIIGMYLLTPVLRELMHKGSRQSQYYLVALWFVPVSFLPFLDYIFGLEVRAPHVFLLQGFVGYYILGFLLHDLHLKKRQVWLVLAVLVGSASCLIVFSTLNYVLDWGYKGYYFYHYENIFTVINTVAVFLLMKAIPYESIYQKLPALEKSITHISKVSYGVYLLHPLFIILIDRGTLGFRIVCDTLPNALLVLGISGGLSIIIVSILRKIPVLKYFAG